ncbi:MAG: SDR family NAD(P)-dependent oxidoreductase, partial [Gemmatimonadota bacterium]
AAGAIGSASARSFVAAGFEVVGLDRDPSVVAVAPSNFTGIVVDLEARSEVARAIERAIACGPLTHVIQIAGGALPEEPGTQDDPLALPIEVFRASLEANLTTTFGLLQAVLPWWRRSTGDRSMTLTSSFNALTGLGMPAYSAAKAGLIGMMHALVGPLGREGIRINVVAPGTIRTPRTERLWAHDAGHFERLEAGSALGRLGTPDDVAAAYVALATQLAHVTGQVLTVDGGQTLLKRGR